MPDVPDRTYLEKLSLETDFVRDQLEKVYRLVDLLKTIRPAPDLAGKLTLKGGTAIHLIHMGLRRLSVDVDLNYTGRVEREAMQGDRRRIGDMLERVFQEKGYVLEARIEHQSEEQFHLSYTNSGGNRDRLKLEINYSERLPVFPAEDYQLVHPFDLLGDITFRSYTPEELWATKVRALLTRGTPRDLYDVHLLEGSGLIRHPLRFRKLIIFYLCCDPGRFGDARRVSLDMVDGISERDVKRRLLPLLRRREHHIGLEEMKDTVNTFVGPVLDFDPEERAFLDRFHDDKEFDQELLFGGTGVDVDLGSHPVVRWRLGI